MEPKAIVLGSEYAAALAAERARVDSGECGPSPLGGEGYDVERDEFNLTTVVSSAVDLTIEGLVRSFRESSSDERERLRQRLSLDDNYTLILFAKRMAVRALNQPSPDLCELGLIALAMIDESRIDGRDASWSAGLLNHAASAWPDRKASLFERASALASSGMAEILKQALGSSALENWGYRELRTSAGIGLVRSGWTRYEPTLDLSEVASRVAARYPVSRYILELELATKLPLVWFDESKRRHAEETLERALGVAEVHGRLRRAFGNGANQMFVTWIAELPTPDECLQLVVDVGRGRGHVGRCAIAVSAGRLFALLVAGSVREGVQPYESPSTLADLAEGARAVLLESEVGRSM